MRTKIDDDELVSFMNKIINQPEVSVKINFDAYDKSISRYNKYASDWKTQTKEGLEIKIRDITRLISRFKITLIEYEGTEYIDSIWFKKQIKILKNYLKSFNASLTRFENLESRISKNERYFDAGKYINEYLTDHKEAIKPNEAKPEPENGVKAWIIYLEQQENESVPDVIERIKQTYNWKFNYKQLRNVFMPDIRKILEHVDNKHFKFEATEKQQSDLILSMSFLKDEKSIKKAKTILKIIS